MAAMMAAWGFLLLIVLFVDGYQYVFITCQSGMEKYIKKEVLSQDMSFRFAFSRPGLLTFKVGDSGEKEHTINSKFMRNFGYSIGSYEEIEDIIAQAQLLRSTKNVDKLRLHVYCRDEGGKKIDHPDYIIEKNNQVRAYYKKLLEHSPSLWWNQRIGDVEAQNGEVILDVVLGAQNEKAFVGYHIFYPVESQNDELKWRCTKYPGNILPIKVPEEAPSRAYAKIEEILQLYEIDVSSNDVIVEIGSSPGGTSYSLLSRGVKQLYGVDPCPLDRVHDPIVLNHPNFIPIKSKLEQLNYSNLPSTTTWLLCDANIPPLEALPHLLKIALRYSDTLKGMIFTCKINDELYNEKPETLLGYINEMETKIQQTNLFKAISFRQLVSNRQEFSLLAVTKRRPR